MLSKSGWKCALTQDFAKTYFRSHPAGAERGVYAASTHKSQPARHVLHRSQCER
jgi:hypothetical protein